MANKLTSGEPSDGPRQLIVLCDGTNNNLTGGEADTHVVLLLELLAAHPHPGRIVFYDAGVGNAGTLPCASLWDEVQQARDRVLGLAQGRGIFENIAESYQFLMAHWRPGDQILLFGFSRGAFTARSLGGLVNQFGLLRAHQTAWVSTLVQTYFAGTGAKRRAVAEQATRLFVDAPARQVPIDFVGVWDTVAAVGMPPFGLKITALPTLAKKRFLHVRQALALDEHRAQFKPRLYAENNGTFETAFGSIGSVQQLWFRGAHGDAGGGYAIPDSRISQHALCWLLSEAVRCGLVLDGPDGRPLDSEAAVAAALASLPLVAAAGRPTALVHDETHGNPLWALTGLMQRETTAVQMDDGTRVPLRPEEHPSVGAEPVPPSVWQQGFGRGWWRLLWAALVALPLLFVALGQQHLGFASTGTVWGDLLKTWHLLPDYLGANLRFQAWQLLIASGSDGSVSGWLSVWQHDLATLSDAPLTALMLDLLFIAAYTVVGATGVVRAMARRSGLRRIGAPVSAWLGALGWALPLLVGSDVAENVLTALVIVCLRGGMDVLPWLLAPLMAVASLAKLVGLAGVLVFAALGLGPVHSLARCPR